jgi:large conductance mechanosensitive channel
VLLQAALDFIIIAFVLFLILKAVNRFKKKEEVVAAPTASEVLLAEIRDELKKK